MIPKRFSSQWSKGGRDGPFRQPLLLLLEAQALGFNYLQKLFVLSPESREQNQLT